MLSAACAVYNAGSKPMHGQATTLVWPTNSEAVLQLRFGPTNETGLSEFHIKTSGSAELHIVQIHQSQGI